MQKVGKVLLWTAIVLVAVGGLLRALLVKGWTVPKDLALAASVEPTLGGGDVVLLLTRGSRGFGDLVRCKDPDDPSQYVIGRILGVEGDVVETKGRNVLVNGKKYDPIQACPVRKYKFVHPNTEEEVALDCGVVEMAGGWHYRGHTKTDMSPTSVRVEVGEGMVFLLSDNIDYHDDSRDFGTLEKASCTERIMFRFVGEAGWMDEDKRLTYIH